MALCAGDRLIKVGEGENAVRKERRPSPFFFSGVEAEEEDVEAEVLPPTKRDAAAAAAAAAAASVEKAALAEDVLEADMLAAATTGMPTRAALVMSLLVADDTKLERATLDALFTVGGGAVARWLKIDHESKSPPPPLDDEAEILLRFGGVCVSSAADVVSAAALLCMATEGFPLPPSA